MKRFALAAAVLVFGAIGLLATPQTAQAGINVSIGVGRGYYPRPYYRPPVVVPYYQPVPYNPYYRPYTPYYRPYTPYYPHGYNGGWRR